MEDEKLAAKINSFSRWHYQFDLKGYLTPIWDTTRVNRHAQRKKYFFDALVELLGGSLSGKRVLDLGCNAGFWSLNAIKAGCEFVFGIDARKMHIDQAKLVFETKEIAKQRYKFLIGNLFDCDFKILGDFDIVLCLGLMYHINKPITLMQKISEVNTDILVIDTALATGKESYFEVRHETLDDPRHAVDYELTLVPSKRAVVEVVQQFGYNVILLKPKFKDYTAAGDYKIGKRRAFLCAKKTKLSDLSAELESLD